MRGDLSHHYSALQLKPGASPDEVKKAFRDLSRQYHPDQFASDPKKYEESLEKQKGLNEAYAALCKDFRESGQFASVPPSTASAAAPTQSEPRTTGRPSRTDAAASRTSSTSFADFDSSSSAAAHGYIDAAAINAKLRTELYEQGRRHESGPGADLTQAVSYYRQAARMGNPSACFRLGCIYLNSDTHKQPEMAAEFFRQSSETGHIAATYNLALMHERGVGVRQNGRLAIELYKKAANAGDEKSKQRLNKILGQRGAETPASSRSMSNARNWG